MLHDVVPGDIVELYAGDLIPGDCYLLEAKDLFVDEASLTGESFYVEKIAGVLVDDVPLSRKQILFLLGTHVVSGTAKAVVVLTGNRDGVWESF